MPAEEREEIAAAQHVATHDIQPDNTVAVGTGGADASLKDDNHFGGDIARRSLHIV